jgi:hypothetical protein
LVPHIPLSACVGSAVGTPWRFGEPSDEASSGGVDAVGGAEVAGRVLPQAARSKDAMAKAFDAAVAEMLPVESDM